MMTVPKQWRELYTVRDLLTGLLVYGSGDLIAALLAGQFSVQRAAGMALVGALLYGLEIPHYFRWVARVASHHRQSRAVLMRTGLAMLYFNPLWVARHLALIAVLQGNFHAIEWPLLLTACQSFLSAIPITVSANLLIQNAVPLQHRFLASALFSCVMAIYYPLIARLFGPAH